MKPFRHDVRQDCRSLEVLDLHLITLDLITDVMILDVDMFGVAVIDRVLRYLDPQLIVLTNHKLGSFLVGSRHDLTQQTVNPLAFLNLQTECNILLLRL